MVDDIQTTRGRDVIINVIYLTILNLTEKNVFGDIEDVIFILSIFIYII